MDQYLIILIVILLLVIAWQAWRFQKQSSIYSMHLHQVALPYFKSQMNPHFIKNLLQTINYFILFDSKENASKYLKKFSVLVDKTLKLASIELISLADEIEILELYLELQHLRFSNKFDYVSINSHQNNPTVFVDDSLQAKEIRIPPMVIQPFVENAIVHGLEPKKEKGFIRVEFSMNEQFLVCKVIDNGIGMDASAQLRGKRNIETNGIALNNVYKRLKLIEKTLNISIQIKVDKYLPGNEEPGTVVTLELPAHFPSQESYSINFDSLIHIK